MKKILSGSIAVAALLALSACSTSAPPAPADTAQATAGASASAKPSEPSVPKEIISSTGAKIPVKGIQNDGKGEYLQTTISDSDPAMSVDQSIVEETAKDRWTPEEIASANKMVVKFIAEEGIDSTLNDNPNDKANTQKWLAAHESILDPTTKDEIIAYIASNDPNNPFVFRGQFRQGKYNLAHGKDVAHVADRKITVKRIIGGDVKGGAGEVKAIGVQVEVQFSLNTDSKFSAGNVSGTAKMMPAMESTSGTFSYTLVKGVKGEWLITGSNGNFSTIPVTG